MSQKVKSTELLASWAKHNICYPKYHDVRVTRNFPPGLHRVQVVYGRWMAVGTGLDYEEAKEKAAEGVMDKIHEAKTPKIDGDKTMKKQMELLEKKLFNLSLNTKQFGLDNIFNLFEKINGNESTFGGFGMWDMYYEVEELFAKLNIQLSNETFKGEGKEAISLTAVSEEYPPIIAVEVGPEETENMIRCLQQVLKTVQFQLENEITSMLEQRKKREQEKQEKEQKQKNQFRVKERKYRRYRN